MKKICFLNDGCGAHESEFRKIFKNLEGKYSLTNFPHKADIIIQYFCAGTEKSEIKTIFWELKYLSELKKEGSILIVCGCAVDAIGKNFFEKISFVDYAVGSKDMITEISKIMKVEFEEKYYIEQGMYSFSIDIVDGCSKKNGWCTFCKQHYLKRAVHSIPMEEICKLATEITKTTSVFVIELTGLNICNYGIDIGDKKPKLHILVKALSKIPTVKFIKLYSLTVENMYEELVCEIESNSKVSLVELGIQSGSNSMLKIMNTGATIEKIQTLLDRLSHKPMRSIVVVSHPGETREYLKETVDLIEKNNLYYMLVSPYQNTEGTPSYCMKQLDKEEYEYHYNKVLKTVLKLRKKFLESLENTFIEGYIMEYTYSSNTDIGHVHVSPKYFNSVVYVQIPNFSSSPYKGLLEDYESGVKIRTKIVEVINLEDMMLMGEGLEVIEDVGNI